MSTQTHIGIGKPALIARATAKSMEIGNARLVGDIVFVIVFSATGYGALSYPPLARTFPLWIGVLATVLSLINLGIDLSRRFGSTISIKPGSAKSPLVRSIGSEMEKLEELEEALEEAEEADTASAKTDLLIVMKAWGWVFGFAFAIWLTGFQAATALFIFTVLKIEAGKSYRFAGIGAALALTGVTAFSMLLDVPLPKPFWWPF